jgi:hypothetical protein
VRKGLALALLVLAGGTLVGCGLLDEEVPTAEVGECVNNDLNGIVEEFEVVDCNESHTGELFFKFELPDGDFPGQEAIDEAITEQCQGQEFEDFVGTPYNDSEIFVAALPPSEQTWNEADDREVLCFAVTQDGSPLTESVEGSER